MSHAIICCSKCRPGSVEIQPTSRGIVPVCVGCESLAENSNVSAKRKPKKKAKR
jgi:hypothetical protein